MLLITTSIFIERLLLSQLLFFFVHYGASKTRETYNFGSLHPANVINSIWDNNEQQLQFGIILKTGKNLPVETKEWKYIIIPRPQLIDLSLYVFNYQQAISSSYKTLDRRRVLKLFNEIYHDRNSDVEELLKGNFLPNRIELMPTPKKRQVRRCGTVLIKHIQKVCNGCLRSSSDSNPMIMSKRVGTITRWKRDAGFSRITDICCTQRACDDEELKPFCC
ncbi:hypothetical protein Mgra_00005243 [Meloidogyne graminicola]|uniref:Uncharacterized protein n=1 Tax=Meloidogyne graminicola TaxID=189291 RepID=A0A8S9ZPP5_9BILA|nr:hypothetical protein Mgra_00005243 [Meloidogyne graminicola]